MGAYYSRLIQLMLSRLPLSMCQSFVDDILISANSLPELIQNTKTMFSRIRACGLRIQVSKTCLFAQEVKYLGFLISPEGIKMEPSYRDVLIAQGPPESAKELRSYLGKLLYYSGFIRHFSEIVGPLYELCNSKIYPFKLTGDYLRRFYLIKAKFLESPAL